MIEVSTVLHLIPSNDYLEILDEVTGELLFYGFREFPHNKVYIAGELFAPYRVTDLSYREIVRKGYTTSTEAVRVVVVRKDNNYKNEESD